MPTILFRPRNSPTGSAEAETEAEADAEARRSWSGSRRGGPTSSRGAAEAECRSGRRRSTAPVVSSFSVPAAGTTIACFGKSHLRLCGGNAHLAALVCAVSYMCVFVCRTQTTAACWAEGMAWPTLSTSHASACAAFEIETGEHIK